MTQRVRIRPFLDEAASQFGGFKPVETRRGYLYARPGREPISQFIMFDNYTSEPTGISVFICSSILGKWSTELGGTSAVSTAQLSYLRMGPSPSEQLLYRHFSTASSVQDALHSIAMDYEAHGAPWFQKIEEGLSPGHLLYEGLEWAGRNRSRISSSTWDDIETKLKSVNFYIPRLEHPVYDALKAHLMGSYDRVSSSKEERQSVPKLALHLIEYAARAA